MCKLDQGYEFDYCLNGWQFSSLSLPDPSKLFSIIEKKMPCTLASEYFSVVAHPKQGTQHFYFCI
jgi:hypothetical protein